VIKKKSLSHINEPHISNQKIVDESDCIIWLDNDQNKVNQPTIKLRSANNKTDRNQVLNNADNEIRNVDRSDANVINLSSDEENSQSKSALAENQQPHCPESQLQAQVQSCQTGVGNKKFKCVKCRFRSNWSESVNRHFTRAHFHVAFNHQQCLQVLDEDEAARTLPAYEQHLNNKGLECKPFKCGMCEYRATQKPHAFFHMRQVHQVTSHEAQRLVEVLPLDEAKNTVKDYNKKFATETGRCCSKLLLEREGATKNSKSTASTVNQSIYTKVLNKKFKCVICQYRSNWPKSVLKHFKVAHPQVVLSHLKRYTELDEDEATRTLNAYEKIRVGRNFIDKPFQCRLCEYRAAQKTNAYTHIRKVHQVEFCEAKKLLKVLPLDEANKTVGDYNQKVAGRESLSVSASINSCATISL
jgi:hydrogenase maturation factor